MCVSVYHVCAVPIKTIYKKYNTFCYFIVNSKKSIYSFLFLNIPSLSFVVGGLCSR